MASGLTCPTRDGSLAKGGCAFCDVRGSGSYFGTRGRGGEVEKQIQARLPAIRERFGASRFLAYFQSYTNTYSDVDALRELYDAALAVPEINGLCIGTRPDCLPEPVIELLEDFAKRSYVSLELGVQSFENPSLDWLARGHSAECALDALERLERRAPHVHVCVHLMFGSPTDSAEVGQRAAEMINQYRVRGVKLHQLMILERTELARRWREKEFPVLSLESYSSIVYDFLVHIRPDIYIERLCATATHTEECLAPDWSRGRWEPHNKIRDSLLARGCKQGARFVS